MRKTLLMLVALLAVCPIPHHAWSQAPEKGGWSVETDPRKRAFLRYVDEDGGPRLLLIGCLRDTNKLGVYSSGVIERSMSGATLRMVNGQARYALRGDVGVDTAGWHTFGYVTDLDPRALATLRAELMPILTGRGPIVLTLGDRSRQLPVAGLAQPLKQFSAICFGR